jgi:hypothetical protein
VRLTRRQRPIDHTSRKFIFFALSPSLDPELYLRDVGPQNKASDFYDRCVLPPACPRLFPCVLELCESLRSPLTT